VFCKRCVAQFIHRASYSRKRISVSAFDIFSNVAVMKPRDTGPMVLFRTRCYPGPFDAIPYSHPIKSVFNSPILVFFWMGLKPTRSKNSCINSTNSQRQDVMGAAPVDTR